MRFNFLIYSPFPHYSGGRETWLRHVAEKLLARGHAVRIYSYRNHTAPLFHVFPRNQNVRVTEVPVPLSVPVLGPMLVRSYLHLVNMALWTAALVALILCRRHSRDDVFIGMGTVVDSAPLVMAQSLTRWFPFVCAVRGPHAENESLSFPRLKGCFYRIERMSTERAVLVIANGMDTQRALAERGVASTVVPNGVDLSRYRRDRASVPVPEGFPEDDAIIVVMTASLMAYRQIDTAIEALAVCRRATGAPRVHLVFAGKGDPAPWRGLAEQFGVSAWVTFLGERRDVAAILAHSDVCLALCDGANAGGLSMSLLEAMAAGKAVIVSDNETYRQVVTDGRNGRIVPERNPEALGRAILDLAANENLRSSLGEHARLRVQEFDWEVVTDHVEQIAGAVASVERRQRD